MVAAILEPKVTQGQELIVPERLVTVRGVNKPSELDLFAARLNELCDDMGVPPKGKNRQAALAKTFQVSQKGARKWLEAEGWPTVERGVAIAKWGGVSFEWLMTGRGSKRPTGLQMSPQVERMLRAMERLPDYLKDAAIEQITVLGDTLPPKPERP